MAIDTKPLRDLFVLGTALRQRDATVRAAHAAGVSKNEIAGVTGLARTTVDRIIASTGKEERAVVAEIHVRMPEPGETNEAYQDYLDGLFAPIGAEIKRLRTLAAGGHPADEGQGDGAS